MVVIGPVVVAVLVIVTGPVIVIVIVAVIAAAIERDAMPMGGVRSFLRRGGRET